MTPLWPGILALLSYAALVVALVAAGSLAFGFHRWYTSPAFTAAVAGLTLAARILADLDRKRSDRRREFFKMLAVGIRDGTGAELSHLLRQYEAEMGASLEHRRQWRKLIRLLKLFSRDLYSPEKYLAQLLGLDYLTAAKSRVGIWIEEIEQRKDA